MVYIDPSNITGVPEFIRWANDGSDGVMGIFILIAIYVTLLLVMKTNWPINKCLASAGFVTAIASILLFTLGVVTASVMYISIILAIIGFVSLFREQ